MALPAVLFPSTWWHDGDLGGSSKVTYMSIPGASKSQEYGVTTEAYSLYTVRAAGVLSDLGVNVILNTRSDATVIVNRKNGSNGALSISVPAGTTGYFEDASNTDNYSAGDTYCIKTTSGSGSGTFRFGAFRAVFTPTAGVVTFFQMQEHTLCSNSTTSFLPIHGASDGVSSNGNEVAMNLAVRAGGTFSNMQIYVSTNSQAGTSVFKSRINGADGNQIISVGAGLTGVFEDVTHSDTVSNSDLICMKIIPFDGNSLYIESSGMFFTSSSGKVDMMATSKLQAEVQNPYFCFIAGNLSWRFTTNEASVTSRFPFDCKLSNMRGYMTNSFSNPTTLRLRINGVNGNQSISVPAFGGASGWYEDATNHDDILAGDDVCYGATGSGNDLFVQTMAITMEGITPPAPGGGGSNLIILSN